MELGALIEGMLREAAFDNIVNELGAQFGTAQRPLLGAQILPEVRVDENEFSRLAMKVRPVIANDATHNNPVQLKGTQKRQAQTFQVRDSDIGAQFTGDDFDAMVRMIKQVDGLSEPESVQAMTQLLNWVRASTLTPAQWKVEQQRWQAIVDAQIVRTGDGGYTETIAYENPTGHRFATTVDWGDTANSDPMTDISIAQDLLESAGFKLKAIYAGRPVISILRQSKKMKERAGRITVAAGSVIGIPGRLSAQDLNDVLADDDVPPITEYNAKYNTQSSDEYFLKRDVMVFVGTTGRDQVIDLGDDEPLILPDTLGISALGTVSGRSTPGRRIVVESFDRKPPRVEAEMWQKTIPAIEEPEAIVVIHTIDTSKD